MEPDSIGKRLKAIRVQKGLSIRALAKQSGVPQSTISFVEQGVRDGAGLSLGTAKKLCAVLGIGVSDLAGSALAESVPAVA